MALNRTQRRNTWQMMLGAVRYCKDNGFTRKQAHQHIVECLMCCRVESNMYIDANVNVPDSFDYHHDSVGSDHYSVGMFQQQVPGWGTTSSCMSPPGSAHHYLHRNTELGQDALIPGNAMALGKRVQAVQVSAFPDRYAGEFDWARRYLGLFLRWPRLLRAVRYPKN